MGASEVAFLKEFWEYNLPNKVTEYEKKNSCTFERFRKNPKVRSCILIENSIQFRNRATAACIFNRKAHRYNSAFEVFRVPRSFFRTSEKGNS